MDITCNVLDTCMDFDVFNSDYYEVDICFYDTNFKNISVISDINICLSKDNLILRSNFNHNAFFYLKNVKLLLKVDDEYTISYDEIYIRLS